MVLLTRCSRTKIEVSTLSSSHNSKEKMPLRPDFNHWFSIICEYRYRGQIRKSYALRSNEFFNETSEQWETMMNRLPQRLGSRLSPEYEVIEGCLKILGCNSCSGVKAISDIIFEKNGKPYFILDNNQILYPTDTHVVLWIDLDRLVKFGFVSNEDYENKIRENRRIRVLRTGALFGLLCMIIKRWG